MNCEEYAAWARMLNPIDDNLFKKMAEDIPVSRLMTIFTDSDAYDDTSFPATSRRKRYFKEDQEGVREMCEIMEKIRKQGIAEGITQGIAQGISQGEQKIILQMYHKGYINLAQACESLNLSTDDFLTLEKSNEAYAT